MGLAILSAVQFVLCLWLFRELVPLNAIETVVPDPVFVLSWVITIIAVASLIINVVESITDKEESS